MLTERQRRYVRPDQLPPSPGHGLTYPWAAAGCSCGWLVTAETVPEVRAAAEVHQLVHHHQGTRAYITSRARMRVWSSDEAA
jgi:hypothetical protein